MMPQKRGRKLGSGRILDPDEEEKLKRLITSSEPRDHGLCHSAWTRKAIAELAAKLFGKTVAERTMSDYLKRWRFSSQVPLRRAYQQDPEKVRKWKEEEFPEIQRKCDEEGGVILFGDEAGNHSESFKNKSYAPVGCTPVIRTTGTRLVVNMISAVGMCGLVRYMTYEGTMTCLRFIDFLKALVKPGGRKIFLVVDNLRVHHGKIVQAWLREHADEIELFFLPPYSPELNPDELFNHCVKMKTHAQPQAASKDEFERMIRQILRSLQKSPGTIMNLFKKEPLKYISAK